MVAQLSSRLRQDPAFFHKAHRVRSATFTLLWQHLPEEASTQIAVIVPKTQLKNSVKRHKLKRRFRAAISHYAPDQPVRVVILARARAGSLSPPQLATAVVEAMAQIQWKKCLNCITYGNILEMLFSIQCLGT